MNQTKTKVVLIVRKWHTNNKILELPAFNINLGQIHLEPLQVSKEEQNTIISSMLSNHIKVEQNIISSFVKSSLIKSTSE